MASFLSEAARWQGKNAVIVCDVNHYAAEKERIRACFERADPIEDIVVPRVRKLGFGQEEAYVIFSAWNYKGARTIQPPVPSED